MAMFVSPVGIQGTEDYVELLVVVYCDVLVAAACLDGESSVVISVELGEQYFRDVSLYRGVFSIVKITTTTHDDIVCISFNSKSAHSNPPIIL